MAEIKSLLDGVIETEILNIGSVGDEKKADAIRNLAALHKLRIEEIKVEIDAEEKRARRIMDDEHQKTEAALKERQTNGADADRERDEQFKQRQLKDLNMDRYVRIGIATAELILPLAFYGVWMSRGLKFEETGTYTSATFKNLFNRFKPTRKS